MLPPVSPTTPPTSGSGARNDKSNSSSNQSDAAAPSYSPVQKPRVEPHVVDHVRFSYAFKKNDAAKIMPFLHKDVTLLTLEGARLEGLSAVLAHLVGPRMAKLSSHMHIKGSPTRSGLAQSKFVYEHGILFRQPLYVETIDWTPDHAVAAIAHVAVPDGKSCKAHFHPDATKPPSPLSVSRGSASGASDSTNNNPVDEDEPEHLDDDALDAALRKSKSLGEPLALRDPNGGSSHWKSSVARHEANPKWASVPIELHARHHRENDVLEVSLWDFHLFKTVKVATAALVVADLFAQEDDEFATTVQLERMELTDTAPPVQLTLRFAHKYPSRHSTASSRGRSSLVEDLDVATDAAASQVSTKGAGACGSCCRELMKVKAGAWGSGVRWYLQDAGIAGRGGSSMLLRAAFVLVLVWLISQVDFDKHAATRG
ncbi:hypothetical protein PybrP1_003612 [[Pythium] brassicae (nom. inval.)]|nr:hypothetical protein PybrP1_003612 [[Pythium] brassicae (nom. inval.)]